MSTPHNQAEKGDFASTVLLAGDPLRAKYIAEHYLKDVKLVNTVRNMFDRTLLVLRCEKNHPHRFGWLDR